MAIKNVLIVDDSKTSRTQLSKLLQNFDLHIDTAESAEEAIDFLQLRRPDAIFLDHTMPGMDGLQALKVIKGNPGTAFIPIAMYTSLDDDDYAERARSQGAVDLLYKPPTSGTVTNIFHKLAEAFDQSANQAAAAAANDTDTTDSTTPLSDKPLAELVRSAVNSQLNTLVKTRLTPALEENLSKIREQIIVDREKIAAELVQRFAIAQRDKLIAEVESKLNEQLNIFEKRIQQQISRQIQNASQDIDHKVLAISEEKIAAMRQEIQQTVTNNTAYNVLKLTKSLKTKLYFWVILALIFSLVAIALALPINWQALL